MAKIEKFLDVYSLKKTWESLFVSDDPFGWPFCAGIDSRMLFYPTEGYHLPEKQYSAMEEAARQVGDTGFLVSIIEGQGEIVKRGMHWWCEFPPYEKYLTIPLILENTHFSRNGLWGIMVSHEDHAVVGGTNSFVKKIRDEYPTWQDDLDEIEEAWKGNSNTEWLEVLLQKINEQNQR